MYLSARLNYMIISEETDVMHNTLENIFISKGNELLLLFFSRSYFNNLFHVMADLVCQKALKFNLSNSGFIP